MATGSGKRAAGRAPFERVNTSPGNINTAITGTYHHVGARHPQSHPTSFVNWFNRCFQLDGVVERLARTAVHTAPRPCQVVTADA